jgi:hypothetical protein
MLLVNQKNNLYEAITDSELPAELFELKEGNSKQKGWYPDGSGPKVDTEVICKNTNYSFKIYIKHDGVSEKPFFVTCSPGSETMTWSRQELNWKSVLVSFAFWLRNLRGEMESVDLWGQSLKMKQCITLQLAEGPDDSPFSYSEVSNIKEALNNWQRIMVDTFELSSEQARLLSGRVERLEKLAETSGRRMWGNILISFLITTAYDLSMNEEHLRKVSDLLYSCINGVYPILEHVGNILTSGS